MAAKLNLELIETAVGFKYVGEMMRQKEVLIGGEESGGLSILGHIPEKDGILACLLVCEAMAITKKTLGELWKETWEFGGYEPLATRLDLHLTAEAKESIINNLKTNAPTKFVGKKVSQVSYKDGIKLVLENGSWVLVRPSGTEPLLRVYLEASCPSALAELKKEAEKQFGSSSNTH